MVWVLVCHVPSGVRKGERVWHLVRMRTLDEVLRGAGEGFWDVFGKVVDSAEHLGSFFTEPLRQAASRSREGPW